MCYFSKKVIVLHIGNGILIYSGDHNRFHPYETHNPQFPRDSLGQHFRELRIHEGLFRLSLGYQRHYTLKMNNLVNS